MAEPIHVISLSLELSSRSGSVALGRDDQILDSEPVRKASRHSDEVMPAIDRLFSRMSYRPIDLNEIYVSVGPGGFTGIRLAVTIAKMLAFATGARILAVPTADVVAEATPIETPAGSSAHAAVELLVALASKRGHAWCVSYRLSRGEDELWWEATSSGRVVRIHDAVESTPTGSIVAADVISDALRTCGLARNLHLIEARPEASACFRAARRRIRRAGPSSNDDREHAYVDPTRLVPLYGREPEAVRLWASGRTSADV